MALSSATLGSQTLTGTDAGGTIWGITKIDGWAAPAGTLAPVQRPRQPGSWAGLSYAQARPIALSGSAVVSDPSQVLAAQDALVMAASLDQTTLAVVEAGVTRTAYVRRDGPVIITWAPGASSIFDWSIQLIALDPRKLGQTLTAGPTGLPSSSGGLVAPFTAPFTVNATQNSGLLSLTNTGNATGPVILRIDGPGSGPIITHLGTGAALTFSTSAVLAAGEFWTVDMERRTVLAQGQSSRNGYITSRGWSGFDPGVNQWAFSSASTSAMTLTVTATEAFQ